MLKSEELSQDTNFQLVKSNGVHIGHNPQKHMTLMCVTCNSFPWNNGGDFRTPILWAIIRSKCHACENA